MAGIYSHIDRFDNVCKYIVKSIKWFMAIFSEYHFSDLLAHWRRGQSLLALPIKCTYSTITLVCIQAQQHDW